MVEMSVESVRINLATNQRVVILKEGQTDRYLFIWIANPILRAATQRQSCERFSGS